MKKIIATILAVMMIAAMSTTAFAAEGNTTLDKENGYETTIDVKAMYTEGLETVNVVSANVSWGEMAFTYHVGGTKTWDPKNHEYVTDTEAVWQATGNTVTVENHSDIAIDVEFSYASETAYSGITGSFVNAKDTLAAHPKAADPESTAAADSVIATLTLEGELSSEVKDSTKIGTITVKIGK